MVLKIYLQSLKTNKYLQINNSDIVAITESDEVCGIRKKVGKGNITALGFAFGYTSDEHLHLIEKIVSLDKIKRQVKVSDPDIQFVLRKGKKRFVFVFIKLS